jgi:hypothetical protein
MITTSRSGERLISGLPAYGNPYNQHIPFAENAAYFAGFFAVMGYSGTWYCFASFYLINNRGFYYRIGVSGSFDDCFDYFDQILTSNFNGYIGYSGLWWNFFARGYPQDKINDLDFIAWQMAH